MNYVGIDPGINGGVVSLSSSGVVEHTLAGIESIYDFVEFLDETFGTNSMAGPSQNLYVKFYIEKAQAMPKQGISSTFNYGKGYGEILGALTARGWAYELVKPQDWMKFMLRDCPKHLEGKKRAAHMAAQLFTGIDLKATPRCKKPHEGLVDALLIADFGRHKESHNR